MAATGIDITGMIDPVSVKELYPTPTRLEELTCEEQGGEGEGVV